MTDDSSVETIQRDYSGLFFNLQVTWDDMFSFLVKAANEIHGRFHLVT